MTRSRLQAEASRLLSADEVRRYIEAPIGDAERVEVRALCEWFSRRYPTPAERLAYVRLAHTRWQRGIARNSQD